MQPPKIYLDFITITCLNCTPLLIRPDHKKIITESLGFLSANNRIKVYAFVIMNNHLHVIWRILGGNTRENVQRDFLKFTSQQILKLLRDAKDPILYELQVNATDRKYQVWERNSLSIPIRSRNEFFQKLNYVHNNPVTAGYSKLSTEYYYSSAEFYRTGTKNWEFLTHFSEYWY